jgi:hypothetical protein
MVKIKVEVKELERERISHQIDIEHSKCYE